MALESVPRKVQAQAKEWNPFRHQSGRRIAPVVREIPTMDVICEAILIIVALGWQSFRLCTKPLYEAIRSFPDAPNNVHCDKS